MANPWSELLIKIKAWANECENITGVLLVGSQARGQARPDSDIDLVIICNNPNDLLNDLNWINQFGTVDKHVVEDWGQVQSVRVLYRERFEVEFGITSPAWAALPMDQGTEKVLVGGAEIIVLGLNNLTQRIVYYPYASIIIYSLN